MKIKIKKFGKFSDFEKKLFFQVPAEKRPFFRWPGKSNFQKFSNKFCMSLEDVKNCLNLNFYENNLKIGFFLAKKRRAKKHFFQMKSEKIALF